MTDFLARCLDLDLPALVLIFLLLWFLYIFAKIQRSDNGFDMKQMLCDADGKPSLTRLGNMVAIGISSWAVMFHVIHTNGKLDSTFLIGYLAVYAGAQTANKFFESRSQSNTNTDRVSFGSYQNNGFGPNGFGTGGQVQPRDPAPRFDPESLEGYQR